MHKKTLAFAGSNSRKSINHDLLSKISNAFPHSEIELIRLAEYDLPLYSVDFEKERGMPLNVRYLHAKISEFDQLIISVAEHNNNLTAFFKNTLDWLSRYDRKFLADKKVFLLSSSPGGRGANSALEIAKTTLPRFGANILDSVSIPNYTPETPFEQLLLKDENLRDLTNFFSELSLSK